MPGKKLEVSACKPSVSKWASILHTRLLEHHKYIYYAPIGNVTKYGLTHVPEMKG